MLFKWRRHNRAGLFGAPDPAHAAPMTGACVETVPPTTSVQPLGVIDDSSGLAEEAAVRLFAPLDPSGDHCVTLGGDQRLITTMESVELRPANIQKFAAVPRRCWVWRDVVLKEK